MKKLIIVLAIFVLQGCALLDAYQMAKLAEAKYKISDIENVAYFEPFYLKDFITIVPKK